MKTTGASSGPGRPVAEGSEFIFDLQQESVRSLNEQLHLPEQANHRFRVLNPDGRHSLAVGLTQELEVTIEGHAGYYCAGMNMLANIYVVGNAATGLAENMMSGQVVVEGDASQSAGASARGGRLLIHGNATARCGISLKGADIVVGGSIGHAGAFMGQSGRLVVLGDAGPALGDSIYEASIFVRGQVSSLGADCQQAEMTDEYSRDLGSLLAESGYGDVDPSEFTRYESARRLYNFKVDNAGLY